MHITITIGCVLFAASGALAAPCMNPVAGANPPRSQWAEMEAFAADKALNPVIKALQPISASSSEINTDYYAVTIDANGQTPQALAEEFRSDLNKIIFEGSDEQSVAPYDAANDTKWKSTNYKGAVLSFVLDTTLGIPSETGAVVVTCASPTDWVFATVTTERDGVHPVSGNRGFGVHSNPDGSLTIFTKAADRVVNQLPYSLVPGTVFSNGELVWQHMLKNLEKRYASRKPRNRADFSQRRPY